VSLFVKKYDDMKNNVEMNNKFELQKYYETENEFLDNYIFSSSLGKDCHTISCGRNFHFMIDKSDNYIKNSPTKKIMLDDDERKSILYIEFSFTPLGNSERFKNLMIEDPEEKNHRLLSPVGLFFISSFLTTNRDKEKGVSIDSIRKIVMDKYINNGYIINYYDPTYPKGQTVTLEIIQQFIIDLFITDFGYFFKPPTTDTDAVTFYQTKQSDILLYFFEKYEAKIEYPGYDNQSYSEWFKLFNDALLNFRGGGNMIRNPESGNIQPPELPSLRHLINWMLISTEQYCGGIRMEKSGGDALRYYLYDSMKHTSDIDSKLFYTNPRIYVSVKKKLISVLIFLRNYLHKNNYFRFIEQRNIIFGNEKFILTFNTTNQDYVSSVRFLPRFFVPLLSLDVRLKFSIKNKNDIIISGYYNIAPLDIGFNKIDSEKLDEKKRQPLQTITLGEPPKIYTGIAMLQNFYYMTPIPSIYYLNEDIKNMYKDATNAAARRMAGKEESDNKRLNLLKGLIESGQTNPSVDAIIFLEEYEEIFPASKLSKEVLYISSMYKKILSSTEEIQLKTRNDIIQFGNKIGITEKDVYDVKGYKDMNSDIILAKTLIEAKTNISTPFGFTKINEICKQVQLNLNLFENLNINKSSLRSNDNKQRTRTRSKRQEEMPYARKRGGLSIHTNKKGKTIKKKYKTARKKITRKHRIK